MPLLDHIRKIAVLRANGLGDFLLATPALRALSQAYPHAEVTYLTLPWLRGFISGRYPYLHRVLAIPPYPRIHQPTAGDPPSPEGSEAFFARMAAEGFDLAVQMHGGGKDSNPFVAHLGARHTLGLRAPGTQPLEITLPYYYYQHEVLRYLELVGLVGAEPAGLQVDVPVLPEDGANLQRVWEAQRPYVVLHMGAGDPRRRWPVANFCRVAERVQARGYTVVLTGRPDEAPLAAQLRAQCGAPVVDLTAQLDLGALTALLHDAALMVSNDTGPAHLAYAQGTPLVAIYWAGNVITAGPLQRARWRPLLSWTQTCPTCGTSERCACGASWVAGVSVEEVMEQVEELVAGGVERKT